MNDPAWACSEVLAAADVVVLAGKRRDFTLRFGAAFARLQVSKPGACPILVRSEAPPKSSWRTKPVLQSLFRPSRGNFDLQTGGPLHPVEVGREVKLPRLNRCCADGGGFSQWAWATVARRTA